MITIILCAGFGTRMYPITKGIPKPLLQVGGRPALNYLMDQIIELRQIESIHIVTNALFYEHFDEWQHKWQRKIKGRDISLHLHNDGSTDNENRVGAITDLALVLHSLETITGTLVAAGDNIFRFSLKPLWERFLEADKNYVLALPEPDLQKLKRTGILELGSDDRVLRLQEKPSDPPSSWICPPLYFLQPSALIRVDEYLAQSDVNDAPGHFISYLVAQEPVYAIRVEGKRLDIGSFESYEEANLMLLRETVILPDKNK
ncbi:MAG TPA: nucleotidyltransferase family protein [Thermodesulfobacteriota bacterium]|nr:nucleotidyltransferase family protein [Thermodesulfobacteriota bacterium]